jgi:hypothetical protein
LKLCSAVWAAVCSAVRPVFSLVETFQVLSSLYSQKQSLFVGSQLPEQLLPQPAVLASSQLSFF